MNLDLALLLASVALTVFLAAVGIEMANNPPTSRKAKWVYRSVFILLGTLLIGTTYWQGKRNIEEQARTRAESLREQQETKLNTIKCKEGWKVLTVLLGTRRLDSQRNR